MMKHPEATLLIEGHCDNRGSFEYNLALGDRRAASVKNFFEYNSVNANRIKTISYGKERPLDNSNTESAWAKNRRAAFSLND